MKDLQTMDFPEIFEEFEREILYDCHSVRTKFNRSETKNEIIKKGRESLGPIVEYLSKNDIATRHPNITKDLIVELDVAWGLLLTHIRYEFDKKGAYPSLHDMHSWIEWARKSTI